ncbi:MAG: DoxX family membrane protein [Cyanobacteria bacterium REEB446]|nr:DoxX family membrane protein [Cyanobacteria bacterium REEB446]
MVQPKSLPRLYAYLLIMRWVIGVIFILNGYPKFSDPSFGSQADTFLATLRDDIIFKPYEGFFENIVLPNAFLVAKIVKYAEVILGICFIINFPIKIAVFGALCLHLNYLAIASLPTFMFLNIMMISAEFAIYGARQD